MSDNVFTILLILIGFAAWGMIRLEKHFPAPGECACAADAGVR
jgi:hypothetical protein